MSGSDPRITGGDYLLYRRCPRSLHRKLRGERLPSFSEADALYPVEPERERLRALDRRRYPDAVAADEAPEAPEAGRVPTLFDARCAAPPFVATVDIWHPQKPQGMAAVLVREGTSIKESYLREAAFVGCCLARCDAEPTKLFIHHVNKMYERGAELELDALFVERDVTRRVRKLMPEVTAELSMLETELVEDPTLERYRDSLCSRPATCPLCAADVPEVGVRHVTTLHRGGHLVRELLDEGITSILDVPPDRLVHPRQHIQQRAVLHGEPQVDEEVLREFIGRLEEPVSYLDFEATSSAIPPFEGVRPWEHVPYLYSLHREELGELTHRSWMMTPGHDGRAEMAAQLVADCGERGSIVVYSAGFERGIITRLADASPEHAERLLELRERIVDLLEPFNDFAFYHHDQRGKVSLKTVLPVLTSYDYSSERIQDGYAANLVYRYLAERAGRADPDASSAAETRKLLADLVSYCAMDTMAMVHVVRALRAIAGG
ncbi:MAG: DUF2779 domain-containing protein [Spirochaetota bacterium]